tara:strand:+ start:401 stop:844 length:444 start_codon:yes stop_codon:yes gene_type:complete
MKIRKAKNKDLDALQIISKEQFKVEKLQPRFKLLLKDNSYQTQIIEEKGVIVGFIVIKFLFRNLIDIYSIAIKSKYQNRGYGYKLLSNILKNFHEYKITLEVSEDNIAKKLYLKCGFKIDSVRKRYYRNKDAILMSYYKLEPGSDES